MKLTTSKKIHYDSGPNMTPMVDVVMVILVFLMLAGSFAGAEHYLVSNLPYTKSGGGNAAPPPGPAGRPLVAGTLPPHRLRRRPRQARRARDRQRDRDPVDVDDQLAGGTRFESDLVRGPPEGGHYAVLALIRFVVSAFRRTHQHRPPPPGFDDAGLHRAAVDVSDPPVALTPQRDLPAFPAQLDLDHSRRLSTLACCVHAAFTPEDAAAGSIRDA
jgi:hypothetical protein